MVKQPIPSPERRNGDIVISRWLVGVIIMVLLHVGSTMMQFAQLQQRVEDMDRTLMRIETRMNEMVARNKTHTDSGDN